MHDAAYNGHEAVVQMLLKAGADVKAVTKDGRTPLHEAAYNGHEAVVQMLLKAVADVKAVDKDGKRPVDLTRDGAIKKLLEAKG